MKLTSGRRWFKASLVGAVATIGLSAFAQSVSAATDPYNSNFGSIKGTAVGYDVSYPQCSTANTPPPGSFTFGIVGVNGGRPFNNNTCLATEYSTATREALNPPSLYINTGYSGAYRKDIIKSDCTTLWTTLGISGSSAQQQAWLIGCSEGDSSYKYAQKTGVPSAAMWWLDVEIGNSWSSSDLTLNQNTINGAASWLAQYGTVGVYSNAQYWTAITGNSSFAHPNIAADWETAGGSCGTGFSGDPVWLTQSTSGGVDSDTAC